MTGRSAIHGGQAPAAGTLSEAAVREIRLQAGRLGRARKALNRLMKTLKAPGQSEIRQMREGLRPVSKEAQLIAALRRAIIQLRQRL